MRLCVTRVANMSNEALGAESRHIVSLVPKLRFSLGRTLLRSFHCVTQPCIQTVCNLLRPEASIMLDAIYGRFNMVVEGPISAAQ
jgi:hypothetical protein